jgi:hypothetical protein
MKEFKKIIAPYVKNYISRMNAKWVVCLRIGTGGELLWTWYWTFGFYNIMVKALGYKLEGRVLKSRWGEILNLPNPSGRTRPWGLLSL